MKTYAKIVNNKITGIIKTNGAQTSDLVNIPNNAVINDTLLPYLMVKNDITSIISTSNDTSIISIQELSKINLLHTIPDTNPNNGIPEIAGDGVSTASITIQMKTGDTYSIQKNGPGEWDYEEVKVLDGQIVSDNTYEGKTLNLFTDKGMLNKRTVLLDANSTGSFKIKSEAKTCIENEAATITITPEDIADVVGTSMRLEFAPVAF